MIASSNANHKSESAGTPCFHADNGVFEYDGASRRSPELPGCFQARLSKTAHPEARCTTSTDENAARDQT